MGRGYSREQYLAIVSSLRSRIPELALSTDLMVGFCGETDEEHRETLSLMDAVRFDTAFMFAYSDRGITRASRHLQDDVSQAVKAARLSEVIALQERHSLHAHQRLLGTRVEALVSGISRRGDRLVGRTPRFHRVLLPLDRARPGELADATVTHCTAHSLFAE
jgi:tRNA-2-methylthio-N6-dimethylallyladenosine synthase